MGFWGVRISRNWDLGRNFEKEGRNEIPGNPGRKEFPKGRTEWESWKSRKVGVLPSLRTEFQKVGIKRLEAGRNEISQNSGRKEFQKGRTEWDSWESRKDGISKRKDGMRFLEIQEGRNLKKGRTEWGSWESSKDGNVKKKGRNEVLRGSEKVGTGI